MAADAALIEGAPHVLAVGKVAFPMLRGWLGAGGTPASGLVIAPESSFPGAASIIPRPIADRLDAALPRRVGAIAADHPTPTARSEAAARAARNFVARLGAADRLLVLLSGGASSLMSLPAPELSLADKLAAAAAVARAGASIAELNCVRKHLSGVKGGRLATATRARMTVLALSDVVGDDPAVIGSGPFTPDPTTFAEALAIVERLAPHASPRAIARLALGASGQADETPKPGDPRLPRVDHRVLAGPPRVHAEARRAIEAGGVLAGMLARETELPIETLAASYVERARRETEVGGAPRVLIGNGEPRVVLPDAPGNGGRALHLALLVARGIAGLGGVSFLAAATDDRDGNTEVHGARVDGRTWPDAVARGIDPDGAIRRFDSHRVLAALGVTVRGPGTSNLLDLHLLSVGAET